MFHEGLFVCLSLLFIKETRKWKSLKTQLLSLYSNQCIFIDLQVSCRCMQARSQSPATAQNPSLVPPLRRRKRVSCRHFSDTGRWWSLGCLSFNFHTTSPCSACLMVTTKLGASCHACIGQWRENVSKCYLQTLGIRSVVEHLNYKFSSLLCLKTRPIVHMCKNMPH